MAEETPPGSRERSSCALRGCSPASQRAPAGEVLASVRWERPTADPRAMTAERFLATLVG